MSVEQPPTFVLWNITGRNGKTTVHCYYYSCLCIHHPLLYLTSRGEMVKSPLWEGRLILLKRN